MRCRLRRQFKACGGRLLFPVLQIRDDGLHVRAYLLLRPGVACHVLHAELDQLLRARILERAVRVAPFAVFLVESTVRLSAGGGILERHAAALADQLPRGTEQRVDRNVIKA